MSTTEYRVLARKYRPSSFSELIGHDTLVKTLSNALQSGRIAHAFMLTGVRGVGKTTTARLIARALNCIGADGTGGPTMTPCGVCVACKSIAEDRHPDVIEMDAASRTGIDDIRELIEAVRYRPVSARYKIYIIDEVHMLSKQAFNGLLKTLEEPPPDIKFVFATTEINKVPITVLSRCQRYTLPRIPADRLAAYYGEIAGREGVEATGPALALIARAADGSVRDGLSILDQAIALAQGGGIDETLVRDMLGVADRNLTLDLFEAVMAGDAPRALDLLEAFYNGGVDPAMVLQDLLDLTHFVTRLKLARDGALPPGGIEEQARAHGFAQRLGVALLSRAWQILLKGLAEVRDAPNGLKAAEMVLIRLIHARDLPPPAELLEALRRTMGSAPSASAAPSGTGSGGPKGETPRRPVALAAGSSAAVAARPLPSAPLMAPATFEALLGLVEERREAILAYQLGCYVHLVRYEPGMIEFRPHEDAPKDLTPRLARFLEAETGRRWLISLSREAGEPTIQQQRAAREAAATRAVEAHPLVRAVLDAFPGATIERIIPAAAAEPAAGIDEPGMTAEADFDGAPYLSGYAFLDDDEGSDDE